MCEYFYNILGIVESELQNLTACFQVIHSLSCSYMIVPCSEVKKILAEITQ